MEFLGNFESHLDNLAEKGYDIKEICQDMLKYSLSKNLIQFFEIDDEVLNIRFKKLLD